MATKLAAKSSKLKSKFLKFNLALDEGLEEILSLIDLEYPEFRFNSSAKIRFALGQLARNIKPKVLDRDLEKWSNSLEPFDKEQALESELEFIKKWSKIKSDL
jgi:hypothetical protein